MDNVLNTIDLKPGMVIVQVTQQNGPVKIRKSGLVTSMAMVQGLVEMGIQQVQIDPAQTVEIEQSAVDANVQKSPTVQLLQTNLGFNQQTDSHLNDPFNRSLFLTSVQDIPSAWQFYGKPYVILLIILLGGLALGFSGAKLLTLYQQNQLMVQNQVTQHAQKDASGATSSDPSDLQQKQVTQQSTSAQLDTISVQVASQQNNPSGQDSRNQTAELQTDAFQTNEFQTGEFQTGELQTDEFQTDELQTTDKPSRDKQATQTTQIKPLAPQNQEQNIVSDARAQQRAEAQDVLSPELVKRFEKVLDQMNSETPSRTKPNTVNQKTNSDEGVPRIDQLPAWVLTELPNMAFSAHMYASEPQDRWVRVNGMRLVEGDLIADKVVIDEIQAQRVILNYAGHQFSMAALTDW
jgi:general secretion pathway protein B